MTPKESMNKPSPLEYRVKNKIEISLSKTKETAKKKEEGHIIKGSVIQMLNSKKPPKANYKISDKNKVKSNQKQIN
jgi:hypothetical protein